MKTTKMYALQCECGAEWESHGIESYTLVRYAIIPYHNHDDNCLKREYFCTNGHTHMLSIIRVCPNSRCNWTGKTECLCHDIPKLDAWPEIL